MRPESAIDDMCIFTQELQRGATSSTLLLSALKNRNDFLLLGLGNIHVERVEYRKSQLPGSSLEHEYLVVTVKESLGAERRGYLLVDRLNDDSQAGSDPADVQDIDLTSAPTSSSTSLTAAPPNQWEITNRIHRAGAEIKRFSKWDPPDALDRIVILRNITEALDVQGQCTYNVLMTMDLHLTQRRVTLEHFLLLVRTTSRNVPPDSQCYWFAYTVWTVLELETGAPVERTRHAERQGTHSSLGKKLAVGRGNGVNESRTPEMIQLQWEAEKVDADQEWDALQQALRAPELARIKAEEALQQERAARQQDLAILQQERAARIQAEAKVNELRATLTKLQHSTGNVPAHA
ncbi:uncharacterized protein EV420DRAFT_1641199 [Desarmillaria tabescens]|uniref:Uncharacterized protein n=1 Tax=Armillaria tabescens TaxID=1929756 RepID=A0AA39N7W2_ARMTA|nr:uncharacterized protein EV420DRAFT_1641199 [Desarmillaria tabescens]KAK0460659.1 hypothetical protein EV420DRAFT_1641199 [Desarmillaria tabescens]